MGRAKGLYDPCLPFAEYEVCFEARFGVAEDRFENGALEASYGAEASGRGILPIRLCRGMLNRVIGAVHYCLLDEHGLALGGGHGFNGRYGWRRLFPSWYPGRGVAFAVELRAVAALRES